MTQHINAIFEHGILRPLGPLDLREQEMVTLSIDILSEGQEPHEQETPLDGASEVGRKPRSKLIGLFADEPEVMDRVMEAVYEQRARPHRIKE